MRMRLALGVFAALWTLATGSAQECINNTNPANCPGSFTFAARTCGVGDPVCTNPLDSAMPQECCTSGLPGGTGGNACQPGGCNGVNNCRVPDVPPQPTTQIIDNGNGTFTARLKFDVTARWNKWAASQNPSGILTFEWIPGATVDSCNSNVALCQYAQSDRAACWIEQTGLTCAGAPYNFGQVSVRISTCSGSFGGCFCQSNPVFCPCWKKVDRPGLSFTVSKTQLGCVVPPPDPCTKPFGGNSSGSNLFGSSTGDSGNSCSACQPAAPGWWSSDDGSLSGEPGIGNAQLRYAAGGVGGDDMPGATAWRAVLGRFWTHDYAERIVVDPNVTHVWLLTRYGGFHEFSNPAAGSGLRLYQTRAPLDELRKLYYDTATSTWQLKGLDGSTEFFRSDGQWDKTVSVQDPAHPIQGTYNGSGQLVSVSFPDGHSDSFTYQSGKLASINQVAVPGTGTPTRTWAFTWSGDQLTAVSRPDGTSYEFSYDPARPGYLTRVDLVAGSQHRVVVAVSYLSSTNRVEKTWRGDPSFTGPGAVDKVTYSYTNPSLPTQAIVTRTISPTFDRVTTFNLDHVAASLQKLRVTSFTGTCPTCGLSPTTTFTYGGSNPHLPSAMTDAKGTRTDFTYTADGRLLTQVEAANVPALSRTTTYTYDVSFPGLLTRVEVPSTSGGSNKRRTDSAYDPTSGVLTSRTVDGFEGGSALPSGFKTTTYSRNGSGEALTIDPPGFGTADVTSFTYNLPGRNGHVADTRTDPLAGTTTFGYDGLNRRTSVTDANGVTTLTTYDTMNRTVETRQLGAVSADDLVTTFTYNGFGDLFCTRLPRGNGIEYDYDTAGRLIAIVRGTAVSSPSATTCLDTALPRERVAFQLDGAGHRTEESLERWNGSAWVSDSRTSHVYTCHRDKTTQGAGSATPSVTEFCYDLNDNLEKVWDPNHPKGSSPNPTLLYEYDELNRLKKTTAGVGTSNAAPTNYTYDVQDHLTSVTDAEGNLTTYTFSDRDLLTQQVSPASGTTSYEFNEHGQLQKTTDALGVVTDRTLDAADRVTQETFGPPGEEDPTLTTTYTYGSTPVQFDVGRLIGITRNDETVVYGYDRFGRLLQDGGLAYLYDKNGYRTQITHPGGMKAIYTPDFADRDAVLSYDSGTGPQSLVTGAGYAAFGPLTSLTLANGIVETRSFDARYFPDRIQAGSALDWDYTVDAVGNPTAISGSLNGSGYSAQFSYEDSLYFLTTANGPWGNRTWTYDKVGNRLTFQRTGEPTLNYTYGGSGHSPRLATVATASGSPTRTWTYDYDAAGNQLSITDSDGVENSSYSPGFDGRLANVNDGATASTDIFYDGRGFLEDAGQAVLRTSLELTPSYSSDGVLRRVIEVRRGVWQNLPRNDTTTTELFYFAGRPVGLWTESSGLQLITTDHLGTPALLTDGTGGTLWASGVEPFRVHGNGLLRYPGQWGSEAFGAAGTQGELYYNLNRWYQPATGRYANPDPLDAIRSPNLYGYALANPVRFFDPLGLMTFDDAPSGGVSCAWPNQTNNRLPEPKRNCNGCDKGLVAQAVTNVTAKANRFCPQAWRNTAPYTPTESSRRLGGVLVGTTPTGKPYIAPWIIPSGDPCVDFCRCEHEIKHVSLGLEQIHGIASYTTYFHECTAYIEQMACLSNYR